MLKDITRIEYGGGLIRQGNTNRFLINGDSPSWIVRLNIVQRKGWYIIRGNYSVHAGDRNLRICYTSGSGLNSTIISSPNMRGDFNEIVYLDSGTDLKFLPESSCGYFEFTLSQYKKISYVEGFAMRLIRIGKDLIKFTDFIPCKNYYLLMRMGVFEFNRLYQSRLTIFIDDVYINQLKIVSTLKRWTQRIKYITSYNSCPEKMVSVIIQVDRGLEVSALIKSIEAQTHRNWEIIFCTDQIDEKCLKHLFKRKRNIIKFIRKPHGDRSLIEALSDSRGDVVCIVTSAGCFEQHAFSVVLQEMFDSNQIDMVYSDSDVVNKKGEIISHNFKPDWSPELLLSGDYIGNPCFFRTSSLKSIDLNDCDASVIEYELTIRVGLFSDENNHVAHVSKVLYHELEESIASKKKGRVADDVKAINMIGRLINEKNSEFGYERSRYDGVYNRTVRKGINQPLVTIIIPTRDSLDILSTCISSITAKSTYTNYEIIIVSNNSKQESTFQYFDEITVLHNVKVIRYDHEFNYSKINNLAVDAANGEYLIFLNNDVEVISENWIEQLMCYAICEGIGIVGAKLIYPNMLVQHAGVVVGIKGICGHPHRFIGLEERGYNDMAVMACNTSANTGACFAIKRDLFINVGGFDECLAVSYNDIDLCLRVKSIGKRNVFNSNCILVHHESLSRGRNDTLEKRALLSREMRFMKRRWSDYKDPYYNINLSDAGEMFLYWSKK